MACSASPPPSYDSSPIVASPSAPSSHHLPSPQRRFRSRPSLIDELLPTPASRPNPSHPNGDTVHLLRRVGSLGVIAVFLSSVVFLASTDTGVKNGADELRKVFGAGTQSSSEGSGWVAQDLDEVKGAQGGEAAVTGVAESESDFESYTMLRQLEPEEYNTGQTSGRTIFIGDIHGSFDPLLRLMEKLSYDPDSDHLIQVGDLVAKGSKSEEVLSWMDQRHIRGVRGNHDQPVLQWRAWMEWAGGGDWEGYVDSLAARGKNGALKSLGSQGKLYSQDWEWQGEHWKIARNLASDNYLYLLSLPLVLHLPSLHTIIVHAGLLPHDPLLSPSDTSQPLVSASATSTSSNRTSEEILILTHVPQNQDPWTLLNMRSIYTSGKRKGKVTKSSKKGTPWSEVWDGEMGRCNGEGKWFGEELDECAAEHGSEEDGGLEIEEDAEVDELKGQDGRGLVERDEVLAAMNCSPVTVIYGHAAGRGLDIKPFSKGLDTGCVYGRELTVLVLGDLSGLEGKHVVVGDQRGLLVSEPCGKGGT